MEFKNFDEFYNKAYNLTLQARNKCSNSKMAIIYARKSFNKSDLNSFYKIGILCNKQIKILNTKENIIKLSIDSMIKNILEHPDLDINDYKKLKSILRNPDRFIQDRKNNLRLFKIIEEKSYEIIIKTTQTKSENFLTTFHRCEKTKFENKKR